MTGDLTSKYKFDAFSGELPKASLSSNDQREVYKLGMEGSFFPIHKVTTGAGSIFMLLFLASIFLVDWINSNILFFFFFIFVTGLAFYSIYLGFKAQSEISRYIKFAEDNSLSFKILDNDFKLSDIPLFDGSFDNARYKIFKSNKHEDYAISNFRFRKEISTKNGNRSETYRRGLITLALPKPVPHILVLREKDYSAFNEEERIKLGAGVDGKIKVYAPKSIHREVLLILTPDVLESLVDNAIEGEIHIVGRTLVFIFDNQLSLDSPGTWEMFDRLYDTICTQLVDQIEKYQASTAVQKLLLQKYEASTIKNNDFNNYDKKDLNFQISLNRKRTQINVHPIMIVLIFGLMSSWVLGLIFIIII